MMDHFICDKTRVEILPDSVAAGMRAASAIADDFVASYRAGLRSFALWLMAAPSGFDFYDAFLERVRGDDELKRALSHATVFQFDDYPVDRESAAFTATFRYLLEQRLIQPLSQVLGEPLKTNLLELNGDVEHDRHVSRLYTLSMVQCLNDRETRVLEVKGTGMDGHWGFHGAETDLDHAAEVISVPINSANRRQQMIDWPHLFPRESDVPSCAYSFTVEAFMRADLVVDVTPQFTKQFSVLACYATDRVDPAVPSSKLKQHPNSLVCLTLDSANLLLKVRSRIRRGETPVIERSMRKALEELWSNPDNPIEQDVNVRQMWRVLDSLGLT